MLRPTAAAAALVLALALAVSPALAQKSGVVKANMDTTCAPCRDFYRYANGHWLDTAQIPASYMNIGAGREMADRNQEVLHDVLEKQAANAATEKDPTLKKVGIFYATLMDSMRANREGIAPLAPELKRIDAIQNRADLVAEFAHTVLAGAGGFGGTGVPLHFGSEV